MPRTKFQPKAICEVTWLSERKMEISMCCHWNEHGHFSFLWPVSGARKFPCSFPFYLWKGTWKLNAPFHTAYKRSLSCLVSVMDEFLSLVTKINLIHMKSAPTFDFISRKFEWEGMLRLTLSSNITKLKHSLCEVYRTYRWKNKYGNNIRKLLTNSINVQSARKYGGKWAWNEFFTNKFLYATMESEANQSNVWEFNKSRLERFPCRRQWVALQQRLNNVEYCNCKPSDSVGLCK